MTALAAPRLTPTLHTGSDVWNTFPVAADVIIYPGAQVALNASGYLVPVTASTTLKVLGIATPKTTQMTPRLGYLNSTGLAAGAMECEVHRGLALMVNSASSDLITKADIGSDCFGVDDQTVAKTNGGTAQVTEATVVYSAGDATGFTITDTNTGVAVLLSVVAATSATATAAALAAKANLDSAFAALYTASSVGVKIFVTKKTAGAFTLVKAVAGSADLTPITATTVGVAATRSIAAKIHDIDTRGVWVQYAAA